MNKISVLLIFCFMTATATLFAASQDSLHSKRAKEFTDLRFGMFIHLGVNTYTDQEWTDGSVAPSVFNPKELDTDQWCRVAKSAGMKYMVLTSKHHDGFCLWNTKYTDYAIKSSPFKKDVVKMLAESCKKYGLKLGLYYSLWDRHEKCYPDTYLYTEFMKNQLQELLCNYGNIEMLWFDGVWDKCSGFGYGSPKMKGEEIMSVWRNEGTYRWQWDCIYSYIKHLNPNCLVMNNSGVDFPGIPLLPIDIRSGERGTKDIANKKMWTFAGKDLYLPLQIEETLSKKYWFYHEGDHSIKSKEEIKKLLEDAHRMDANLLLNVGPMTNGKLRQEDVLFLESLHDN
ncbi:hypothetical protein AwDysgo_05710 [Bacteroidales bacterium]|nr:hypothetical protein AwDysgo_05710 [Bacteroidales bacterium]